MTYKDIRALEHCHVSSTCRRNAKTPFSQTNCCASDAHPSKQKKHEDGRKEKMGNRCCKRKVVDTYILEGYKNQHREFYFDEFTLPSTHCTLFMQYTTIEHSQTSQICFKKTTTFS